MNRTSSLRDRMCMQRTGHGISACYESLVRNIFAAYRNDRPILQIPHLTSPISNNTQFKTEICTLLFWMVHCGIWEGYIVGFRRVVYSASGRLATETWRAIHNSDVTWPADHRQFDSLFKFATRMNSNASPLSILLALYNVNPPVTGGPAQKGPAMPEVLPCHAVAMHLLQSNITLQWRHNERDGVSNHQPHNCLQNRLFNA